MALPHGCRLKLHAGPGMLRRNGQAEKQTRFIFDMEPVHDWTVDRCTDCRRTQYPAQQQYLGLSRRNFSKVT